VRTRESSYSDVDDPDIKLIHDPNEILEESDEETSAAAI
jgi:hypothetical protein